ncbi:MAG: protease modulator HflC [Candidatus Omnitrophota bacterium]|nr:MAG: protease modulator HflC [Candidatus Omnitrophota bacterium]
MKKQVTFISVFIIVLLTLMVVLSSAFIVTEVDQAIITQFGRPVRVIAGISSFTNQEALQQSTEKLNQENNTNVRLTFGAGLYFKVPFIQNVEYFSDLILEYDSQAASITTRDKKRIVVDNFARWRIADPLRFKIRLQTETLAMAQLDDIIYSVLRSQLGKHDFIEIIRSTNNIMNDTESEIPEQKLIPIEVGRVKIIETVREQCREAAEEYGIQIIDVRIKRADLPEGNLQAVYQNMTAERERISNKYIEEGNRNAAFIRAETDRTVQTMLAEAERKARVIQGEADAEAARIYARGFIKSVTGGDTIQVAGFETDPEFYKFLRSLEALETTLDANTNLILDTQNDLLKYLDRQIPTGASD